MKISIIGTGNVAITLLSSLKNYREIDEIAMVGRNTTKISGEIKDMIDSKALDENYNPRITGGGYSLVKGSDIIIFTLDCGKKSL